MDNNSPPLKLAWSLIFAKSAPVYRSLNTLHQIFTIFLDPENPLRVRWPMPIYVAWAPNPIKMIAIVKLSYKVPKPKLRPSYFIWIVGSSSGMPLSQSPGKSLILRFKSGSNDAVWVVGTNTQKSTEIISCDYFWRMEPHGSWKTELFFHTLKFKRTYIGLPPSLMFN